MTAGLSGRRPRAATGESPGAAGPTPARRAGLSAPRPDVDGRVRSLAFRPTGSAFEPSARRPSSTCRSFPATRSTPRAAEATSAIQACADDPQVAVHAIRNLSRIAAGRASRAMGPAGFGKASSTATRAARPRATCSASRTAPPTCRATAKALAKHVWAARGDDAVTASWMTGGSYLSAGASG